MLEPGGIGLLQHGVLAERWKQPRLADAVVQVAGCAGVGIYLRAAAHRTGVRRGGCNAWARGLALEIDGNRASIRIADEGGGIIDDVGHGAARGGKGIEARGKEDRE